MRRWLGRFAWVLPALGLGAAAGWLPLPVYGIGPGTPVQVQPLIRVGGHPVYRDGGRLILTTIAFRQLSAMGALVAWLDPAWAVVSRDELFAPGETEEEEERRSRSEMDQSKVDAAVVVLSRLTDYPRDHRPGVLVESVVDGCPAERELAPGDVVVEIGDARVRTRGDASRAIRAAPAGEPIDFRVRSGGDLREFALSRERCAGNEDPVVGVVLIENLPFRIVIASGPIGGPSAGLTWALGLYDLLTPGDLTGGRTVAGTGSIDLDGDVGPIGGISEKVHAAADAGTDVFLVPRSNLEEARAAGVDEIRLVPVATFDDALSFLEGSA